MIEEHAAHLLRLAYLYVKNRQTAEDIVQEVFIKFSQRGYEERGQLRAYLSTLTINQSKDYLKSWHYKKLLLQEKIFPVQGGNRQRDELVAAEERSQIGGAAILKLSLTYREPIILYYFEEMKIRDIAQLLGIAENTVKTRLKRAREALKSHLKQEEWEVLRHE